MYCTKCGQSMGNSQARCTQCGASRYLAPTMFKLAESATAVLRAPRSNTDQTTRSRQRRLAPRTLIICVSASAIALILFLILPYEIGIRAESEYRAAIAQMSSDAVRLSVDSYDRGWFTSTAGDTVDLGGRQVEITQEIHHGPFPFAGSHHSLRPVLAIVESRADLPLDLKSIVHVTKEGAPALAATAFLYPGGSAEISIAVAPLASGSPDAGTQILFDGGQCVWWLRRGEVSASGRFNRMRYAEAGARLDASALSFDGDLHLDTSGLWLHKVTWLLSGVELKLARDPDEPMLPSRVAFDALSITSGDSVREGLLQTDTRLAMKRIVLPDGKTVSSGLEWQLLNVDPHAVVEWLRDNQAIARSGQPATQQISELGRSSVTPLVKLAKAAPKAIFKLDLQSPYGVAASTLQAGIKPGFSNESFGGSDGEALVRELSENYAYASAEIVVPASLFADPETVEELNGLLARGLIVREGNNVVSRATYSRGQVLVNGQSLN